MLEQALVAENLLRLWMHSIVPRPIAKEEWLQGVARGTRPAAHFRHFEGNWTLYQATL